VSIVTLDTGGGSGGGEDDSAFIESLRLAAADTLERAYRFLETQPDGWALLRAQVVCQARPAADLARKLGESQEVGGSLPLGTLISGGEVGFPVIDVAALSDVERGMLGTLEGMLVAGDARALHAAWVEPAVRYLEAQQQDDGAYRIAVPGGPAEQEAADVFFTGMITGICGRTPVSKTAHLEAGGRWLAERFTPDAVEHDGYAALLAYAHYYTNVPDEEADQALQWCGRALEKGFRSRHLDAVSTLRVLLTCDAQAMPGATFDIVELLERLMEEQAGDGGFAELSLGGPETRTSQTVDAMIAIVRLCAVLGVEPD